MEFMEILEQFNAKYAPKSYAYQGALVCPDCARQIMVALHKQDDGAHNTTDSDDFPQGVMSDESDSPEHCDGCGLFLENALTSDGYEYVKAAVARFDEGNAEAIETWREFYNITD